MNTATTLIDFFESQLETDRFRSKKVYAVVINNLKDFLSRFGNNVDIGSSEFLEAWLVDLCFKPLNFKSAIHYLDIVSSLFSDAVSQGLTAPSKAFRDVKARLQTLGESFWAVRVSDSDFQAFLNMVLSPSTSVKHQEVVKSIILFTLLTACPSVGEVAALKKDHFKDGDFDFFLGNTEEARNKDASRNISCADKILLTSSAIRIAESHFLPRHSFIFSLDQSRLTPRQLSNLINKEICEFLTHRFIKIFNSSADETLRTFWALASLKAGISPHAVVAIGGQLPYSIPVLSICKPSSLDLEKKKEIADTVGKIFLDNPLSWFVMRLRRGVAFATVLKNLERTDFPLSEVEFFYPMEEMVKQVDGKLKFVEKPVIKDLVFFRTRITLIYPLFRLIGDLAWCYKSSSSHKVGYAVIPDKAIQFFKEAIGHFAPGTLIGSAGSIPLEEGDSIVVIGPPFKGLEGLVKEKSLNKKGIIYRITLFGDSNDIEWRIDNPLQLSSIKKLDSK